MSKTAIRTTATWSPSAPRVNRRQMVDFTVPTPETRTKDRGGNDLLGCGVRCRGRCRRRHTRYRPSDRVAAHKPARTSKCELVTALLTHSEGASVTELMAATGWLPHTTREVLSGLRKHGMTLERGSQDGTSRCRIAA